MARKIAVLMGGTSLERGISLQSGARVVEALESLGHRVLALDIVPELVDTLISERPDAVYIALHGRLGEDGAVQEMLEFLGIPYTGPNQLTSILAWDKDLAKLIFREREIPTPLWECFSQSSIKEMGAASALHLVPERVGGFPLAVKPARQGSALGLHRVEDPSQLSEAVLDALAFDTRVVIEKWIDGVELAVPVLSFGGETRTLPSVEIEPKTGIYDFDAMYTEGASDYYVPARLPQQVLDRASELAIRVHESLGCRDLSRVDMVADADGEVYVLECSTLPGLTETSVLLMSAEQAGITLVELVDQMIGAALKR